ncbi:hypothetical protein DLAC_01769 [Tieghemostelium lacteum]|uniref:Uncharacterized protein n=1 Tax=Tieghemostelium lacteum TaxID=361077 RepID=A0A152A695_TIELA|nr:hypothetical protein DLAC_01769 [Tieghemostelium lacteum]|eukprot:KYR01759.1 hypothetical protein DLAC_01769 [Tieghemostelium lacteum]
MSKSISIVIILIISLIQQYNAQTQYVVTTMYDLEQNSCDSKYYYSGVANLVGSCYEGTMVVLYANNNTFSIIDYKNLDCTGEVFVNINYSFDTCYVNINYTLVDNWQIPQDHLIIENYNQPCSVPVDQNPPSQVTFYPINQCRTLSDNNLVYVTCSSNITTSYYYGPQKPSTSVGSTGTSGSGSGSATASSAGSSSASSSGSSQSGSGSGWGSQSWSIGSESIESLKSTGSGTSASVSSSSNEHQCPGYNYEKVVEEFPPKQCLPVLSTYIYCN